MSTQDSTDTRLGTVAEARPSGASPPRDSPVESREADWSTASPSYTSPGAVSPFLAVLRRPLLTFLPIMLILLPALVFALNRPPVHTASAQILVGRIDVEASAVPGFVQASQQLAATYARLVSTTIIADRVSTSVGVPVRDLRGRLSASPIPESSIIQVEATASTAPRAEALAAATADALIDYVVTSNENPERQKQLLDAYGAAAAEQRAAESARNSAQGRLAGAEANEASPAELADRRAELDAAQAALDQATLRATTADAAYRDSQRGSVDRGALQLITEAEVTGNDRRSRLQLAVVASLLVGGLIGVAIASLRENRAVLRNKRLEGRIGPTRT